MALSRRGFLEGIAAVLAAPMIVQSGILMPIKKVVLVESATWTPVYPNGAYKTLAEELAAITRKVFIPRLYADAYAVNPVLLKLLEGPRLPIGMDKVDPVLWAANFGSGSDKVDGNFAELGVPTVLRKG